MFTAWLRRVLKGSIDGVARFLGRAGVSADAATMLGALLSIGVGLLIAAGHLRLGGLGLVIASAFVAFDGTLARQNGTPTKFGAFLDSVLDRVSESAMLLGLAWWHMRQGHRVEPLLAYLAIVGSLLVSYTRARAEGLGIDCKVGIFTRVERCIVLALALFFRVTSPALWLLAIGTLLTALHRVLHVYSQSKGQPLNGA